jgi:exodeoxyribonuclease-3
VGSAVFKTVCGGVRASPGGFDSHPLPPFQSSYCTYVPSGQRDRGRVEFKLRFYAVLLERLDALHAQGRHVVLCGDPNTAHREIDLARPRANARTSGFLPEERAWLDTFRALHPGQPGHYTWWSAVIRARERNVGWRLDYFLVSAGLMPGVRVAAVLLQVEGSDHCPVRLEVEAGQG